MSKLYKHKKLGVVYHKPTGFVMEKRTCNWVVVGQILEDEVAPLDKQAIKKAETNGFRVELPAKVGEQDPPEPEDFFAGFEKNARLYTEYHHGKFISWALPFSKIVQEHSGIDISEWKDAPDGMFVFSACFCTYEKMCKSLGKNGVFGHYRN
jgi:hypothetical protein